MRTVPALVVAGLALVAGGCATGGSDNTSPKQAAAYNTQLGIEYLRQGNLTQAKEKLERAIEQDPSSGLTQAAAGLLYDRLGETKKADRHFSRAVSLEPENADILNNYAVFLCRNGEPDRGQEYFLEAARNPLYRTPEVALLNAGNCARAAGEPERAEDHLRKAISAQPRFPDALLELADLQYDLGNMLPARGFLERFFAVGGTGPQGLWLGVRIEQALDNRQAAAEYAARLRTEYPTSRQTRELLKAERGGA